MFYLSGVAVAIVLLLLVSYILWRKGTDITLAFILFIIAVSLTSWIGAGFILIGSFVELILAGWDIVIIKGKKEKDKETDELLFKKASSYAEGYREVGYDDDQIASVRDAFIDGAKYILKNGQK